MIHKVYGEDAANVLKELEDARTAYHRGDKPAAFRTVEKLVKQAAEILTRREAAAPQ